MEITWIGNTSFLIKNCLGKKILLDPIQLYPYIQKYDLNPDIITFSHTHNEEFINDYIGSNCKIINSVSKFENSFSKIQGIPSYRDNFHGYKRGENIIYLLEIDGFRLAHLGSLGHILKDESIKTLSDLDFLFIPIGGHFCLDGYSAAKLALTLKPKYIIPMCFKSSSSYFYLNGPLSFLSSIKNVVAHNSTSINTNELSFHNKSTVIFLEEIIKNR